MEDSFEPKGKCKTKLVDTQAVDYTELVQLRRSTRIRRAPDRVVL